MHASFNLMHGTAEQSLVALANKQIRTYKVSVLVAADCDKPPRLSVLDYFDPHIEIVRIRDRFRTYFANYHILRLNPMMFYAHCKHSQNLHIWVKPCIKRQFIGNE